MKFKWPVFVMEPLARLLALEGFTTEISANRLSTNASRSVLEAFVSDPKIPAVLLLDMEEIPQP